MRSEIPPLTCVGLVIALLALPAIAIIGVPLVVAIVVQWVVAVIVLGIALVGEGASLRDLGFRRPAPVDVAVLLGTTIAAIGVFVVLGPVIEGLGLPTDSEPVPSRRTPRWRGWSRWP